MTGFNQWVKDEFKKVWDAIIKLQTSPSSIPIIPEIIEPFIEDTAIKMTEETSIENPEITEIKQELEIQKAAIMNNKETLAKQLDLYREVNEHINTLTDKIESESTRITDLKEVIEDVLKE